MNLNEMVSLIKDVFTIVALILGALVAVFIYYQLAPILTLRILPRWAGSDMEYLIARVEIENRSRVRVYKPRGKIQVLKHKVSPGSSISQWVPFEKGKIESSERPLDWIEPIDLFTTTHQLYPGEKIAYERLYHYPDKDVVYHIGLQVSAELSFLERLITRHDKYWRQTTTCFVVKDSRQMTGDNQGLFAVHS